MEPAELCKGRSRGQGPGMAAERGRERSQTEKDVAGEEKEGEADGKGVERQEEKKETQKQMAS